MYVNQNKSEFSNNEEKCASKITIYAKLPITEILVYYIGWISGMLYMLYNVYLVSMEYQERNELLIEGWLLVGPNRDAADIVTEVVYSVNTYIIFYGILHYVLAEVLKHFWINVSNLPPKTLPYYYFLFSLTTIIFYSSYKVGAVLIIQAMLSFLVAYFGNTFYIWCYGLTAITILYFPQQNLQNWCNLEDSQLIILIGLLIWNNLRYLAFALHINESKKTKIIKYEDFVHFLGYYFYFPTVCHGPLLLYNDFLTVYKIQKIEKFSGRLRKFTCSIIKYTIYLHLMIFSLHFLHYGLLFQMRSINMNYSASHGFFWWAGYLLMLKYLILYGMVSSAATAEGIRTSNPPKCIGRIALYSEMWKNFDQSMHWFKKRYIFDAFVNNSKSKIKQMMGSLLCFAFIIIWHGSRLEIIIWATLNYIETLVEQIGYIISKTDLCTKIYTIYLTPQSVRRIAALLSAPLLCMSCISQYFFLSSHEIAQQQLKRIIYESYFVTGSALLVAYCGCQVSIEIKMKSEINVRVEHIKAN